MRGRPPTAPAEVTDRQREVARLVAEGLTNEQIAERMEISLAGAKYHVSELLGRLGLQRREEIAEWYAREQGGTWRQRLRAAVGLPVAKLLAGGAGTAVGIAVVAFIMASALAGDEVIEGAAIDTIETAHGRWEVLPPPPAALVDHFVLALGGRRLLIAGGEGANVRAANERRQTMVPDSGSPAWILDIGTGRYRAVGPLAGIWLDARPTLLDDGTVLIAGGTYLRPGQQRGPGIAIPLDGYRGRSQVWRFDVPTGTFEQLTPIERDHVFLLAVDARGRMTIATYRETGQAQVVADYDPRTQQIAERVRLVEVRPQPAPAQWPFVADRFMGFVGTETVQFLDTATGTAIEVESPADFLHWPVDPALYELPDGRLLIAGGLLAADEQSWRLRTETGATPDWRASEAVFVLDPPTGEITRRGDLPSDRPVTRDGFIALPDDGRALVRAARGPAGIPVTYIYDPEHDTYALMEAAPELPRDPAVAALPDGSIVLIGTRPSGDQDGHLEPYALRFVPEPRR